MLTLKVVNEVRPVFERYEQTLIDEDVGVLVSKVHNLFDGHSTRMATAAMKFANPAL